MSVKSVLNSEKISLQLKSKKSAKPHFSLGGQDSYFLGDLSQREKLSEIEPPLQYWQCTFFGKNFIKFIFCSIRYSSSQKGFDTIRLK